MTTNISSVAVSRERLRRGIPTGQITVVCYGTRPELTAWTTSEIAEAHQLDGQSNKRTVLTVRIKGSSQLSVEQLTSKMNDATALRPAAAGLIEHVVECQQYGGISFQPFSQDTGVQIFIDNADLLPDSTLLWLLGSKKLANISQLPWDVVLTAPDFQKLANRAYRLYEDSCMLLSSEPLPVY